MAVMERGALARLANTLHHSGTTLDTGSVVRPGSCSRAVPVTPGSPMRAEFATLGDVNVAFAADEGTTL
jgi:2-keto-4-pentenoate hydratase